MWAVCRHPTDPGDRGDIDDLVIALGFHDAERLTGAIKQTIQVGVDHLQPAFVGHLAGDLERVLGYRRCDHLHELDTRFGALGVGWG